MDTTSHSAGVHGHSMYDANAHSAHDRHETHDSPAGHGGHDHGLMVAELKRRFWISLLLTLPILILSPVIQHALGLIRDLARTSRQRLFLGACYAD